MVKLKLCRTSFVCWFEEGLDAGDLTGSRTFKNT